MSNINIEMLKAVASGQKKYISQADGMSLVQAGVIKVDMSIQNPNDASEVACRVTQIGIDYLNVNAPKEANKVSNSNFQVMTSGITLPAIKRGGGGGAGREAKYPFEQLNIGGWFYVKNSEVKGGNALKSLGSTVSAQNAKYSEETGETKVVERTVSGEGNKAERDEKGNPIRANVTVAVKKQLRKFVAFTLR